MFKKILLLISLAFNFFYSYTQCDNLSYYFSGNINNSCVVLGDDITFSYPSDVYFYITDLNGNQLHSTYPNLSSLTTWTSSNNEL